DLLGAIPGLELAEVGDGATCCGSAGVYNLLQPEAARELGVRKAAAVRATGAALVVSANPGCSLQIAASLAATDGTVPALALAAASQASSSSPSATITAGPLSQPAPAASVTVSCPPGTDTCQLPWSCPAAAAAAAAAATAPVPQDLVSPEPRSCTRISAVPGPVTRTSSTLPPSGNCAASSCGGPVRSKPASGASTRQARCGFPTDTRWPSQARPPGPA